MLGNPLNGMPHGVEVEVEAWACSMNGAVIERTTVSSSATP